MSKALMNNTLKHSSSLNSLSNQEIDLVSGAGWCEAGFMAAGGLIGGGVGGYFSGGFAAAAGFSLGVTLGQDLGGMVCSSQ